jgi:hypothetical protein
MFGDHHRTGCHIAEPLIFFRKQDNKNTDVQHIQRETEKPAHQRPGKPHRLSVVPYHPKPKNPLPYGLTLHCHFADDKVPDQYRKTSDNQKSKRITARVRKRRKPQPAKDKKNNGGQKQADYQLQQ